LEVATSKRLISCNFQEVNNLQLPSSYPQELGNSKLAHELKAAQDRKLQLPSESFLWIGTGSSKSQVPVDRNFTWIHLEMIHLEIVP
jgi:hypothetical protein